MIKKRKIQHIFRVLALICVFVIVFSFSALAADNRVEPSNNKLDISLSNSCYFLSHSMTGQTEYSVWWERKTQNNISYDTCYIYNTGHAQFEWLNSTFAANFTEGVPHFMDGFGWSVIDTPSFNKYKKNNKSFYLTPGETYTFCIDIELLPRSYIKDMSIWFELTLYACPQLSDGDNSLTYANFSITNYSYFVDGLDRQKLYFDFKFVPDVVYGVDNSKLLYYFAGFEYNLNSPIFNDSALASINKESSWIYTVNVYDCFLSDYLPVDNLTGANNDLSDSNDKLDESVGDVKDDIVGNYNDALDEWDYYFKADDFTRFVPALNYVSGFVNGLINALDINFILQLSLLLGALAMVLTIVINSKSRGD